MGDNRYVGYINSPLDYIEIGGSAKHITHLVFVREKRFQEKSNSLIEETKKQLWEYLEGERKTFHIPLLLEGTDFQKRVWKELLKIPYGNTLSYGDIAKRIGNSKASRAVGGANNRNKISIIIPCHRVIGANGKLVGYGGGMWRKEWLLDHEKKYRG